MYYNVIFQTVLLYYNVKSRVVLLYYNQNILIILYFSSFSYFDANLFRLWCCIHEECPLLESASACINDNVCKVWLIKCLLDDDESRIDETQSLDLPLSQEQLGADISSYWLLLAAHGWWLMCIIVVWHIWPLIASSTIATCWYD